MSDSIEEEAAQSDLLRRAVALLRQGDIALAVAVIGVLMVLLLPVGLAALAHRARLGDPGSALRAAVIFLPCLALALTLGGRDIRNGLIEVPRDDAPLYRFIADLPPASLIAGWPQGLIDNVPIVRGEK